MSTDIQRTIEAVWRIESTKVTAAISRLVRDVGLAEELAQDAFVAALEQWPKTGIPDRPAAWLMRTARNKAVDRIRRNVTYESKQAVLARDAELGAIDDPDWDAALDDPVGDDILRLMFIACHPALSMEARVALTLRLLGGLTTAEIARAFLSSESTIAQRIVRAKRTLSRQEVRFEPPPPDELAERLSSVLEVIYLIFNEGYAATSGDSWLRAELCLEALRLGRILAGIVPGESEAHGLLALMELQASRFRTRVDAAGNPVRLPHQDRRRSDRLHIQRGIAALDRARALASQPGFYLLQAEIAACHARARTFEETDWRQIVRLYDQLALRFPSPVVDLNRAVAVGMADGPEAGLELVEALATEPLLSDSHLLAAVRGDLLERAGRLDEARAEFARAAQLTQNEAERQLLTARAESL